MNCFENLNDLFLFVCNVVLFKKVSQLSLTNCDQCFFRPLTKPIQSTAIDQRREHSQSGRKGLTDWTHCNDDVNVLLYSRKILAENVHFVWLKSFFEAIAFASIHDFIHVFLVVKSCDITGIED